METSPESDLRDDVCRITQQLWQRGLLSGSGGTVATELHRRRYLATPEGRRRPGLKPADLITLDLQGIDQSGSRRTSPRFWLPHRLALDHGLRQTPEDIGAGRGLSIRGTILASPPHLLAFAAHAQAAGANGIKLRGHAPVPILDPEDESALAAAVATYRVLVVTGHGVFATGPSVGAAASALEDAESAAHLTLTLQLLHPPAP